MSTPMFKTCERTAMWTIEQLKGRQVYFDANVFIYAFETPKSSSLPSRALGDIF